ncbi:tetraspanin-11-like [Neltuma alba]|uniref:tetraspanin-11-like n=1 Tax=Neltuma alba TaxID=207710 RepID=UPI0010A375E5|nr:tetraspanin-11-like [Prosopis alba]
MVHRSNAVVGVFNVLTLLLGLAAVGGSIYIIILGGHASDCQKLLRNPLLIGGVLLVLVSTLGIVGSLGRVNVVMSIFLLVTFLLIVILIFWTVFALFGTHTKLGQRIWQHYKVTDFKHWLQRYVIDDYQHWKAIKSCLIDAHVCRNLAVDDDQNDGYLIFRRLSITQSGCCKPPLYCGFRMENVTFWVEPTTGPVEKDSDCERWNNRQDKLCYDCNSCKGGVLADTKLHWRRITIWTTLVIIYLTISYVLSCYALWNNRSDSRPSKHHTQPALNNP